MHPLRELAARLHAALHKANLFDHPLHDEVHAVAEHMTKMADADEAHVEALTPEPAPAPQPEPEPAQAPAPVEPAAP